MDRVRAPVFVRALILFLCMAASASLQITANHAKLHDRRVDPRVAILLRGESYRSQIHMTNFTDGERGQVGAHKRRTCEDDAFAQQQGTALQHMEMVRKIEGLGLSVDMFGATYDCLNGQDYVSKLQSMYAPNMKILDVLPKPNSSQLSTMAHVMERALSFGVEYDGYYFLRWDDEYPQLLAMDAIGCFTDEVPQDGGIFGGSPDVMIYVPGVYARRFMSFMSEGVHSGDNKGCCFGTCPQVCNDCIQNFREVEKVTGAGHLQSDLCLSSASTRNINTFANGGVDHTDDDCIDKMYPEQSAGHS